MAIRFILPCPLAIGKFWTMFENLKIVEKPKENDFGYIHWEKIEKLSESIFRIFPFSSYHKHFLEHNE